MATSEVQICNRALQKVGASRITSLLQDSKNARACNVAYETVRDALLRAHRWNFAIKRVTLAPDSASPDFGYDYQFTIPTDCLYIIIDDENDNWVVEGRKILTNDGDTLELRYVSRVTDTRQMDSLFREALSAALAVELVDEIAQPSEAKVQRLERWYERTIAEARRRNAFEQQAAESPTASWITVRTGYES